MSRLFVLVILAMVLIASGLLGVIDNGISIADTGIPGDEATGSVSKASNSSTTITITTIGVLTE